jgi:hypothetical protein
MTWLKHLLRFHCWRRLPDSALCHNFICRRCFVTKERRFV